MSQGAWIVVVIRLLVPLTILRWRLAGGILSMLVDAVDVVIIELIGRGGFGAHYAALDKGLDTYYLTIELCVALTWKNPYTRRPAAFLFVYRLIGVIVFELTERRVLLFFFPNLFENWWLYCVAVERFWPRLVPASRKMVVAPLALLLIPKMGQEYLLHYAQAQPWNWTKRHILGR